jgi:protein O-GlcNAc transferase
MGVPVVTRVGSSVVGRAGLCHARNLDLTELVAVDDDAYVAIAAELAADLPRLGALRQTLRDRLARSALMDAPRFVRGLESAYRTAFRSWCAARPAP